MNIHRTSEDLRELHSTNKASIMRQERNDTQNTDTCLTKTFNETNKKGIKPDSSDQIQFYF